MSQNSPQMTNEQVKRLLWLAPQFNDYSTEDLEIHHAKISKRVEYKIESQAWDMAYFIELLRVISKTLSDRYIEDAKAMNYRQFVK